MTGLELHAASFMKLLASHKACADLNRVGVEAQAGAHCRRKDALHVLSRQTYLFSCRDSILFFQYCGLVGV